MLNVEVFTPSCTEFFLNWIVLREMHRGAALFFVSSFRFVVQSLTKFYTEMHGVFFELDCVERDAQRRYAFFCFKFQVSGL